MNQSFANDVLGGQNLIGRRIRRAPVNDTQAPGSWLEVVGVVPDLGMVVRDSRTARFYQLGSADIVSPLRIARRLRESPASFAARRRTIASGVDPTLQFSELMPLDAVRASGWIESQYLSCALAVLSAIVAVPASIESRIEFQRDGTELGWNRHRGGKHDSQSVAFDHCPSADYYLVVCSRDPRQAHRP